VNRPGNPTIDSGCGAASPASPCILVDWGPRALLPSPAVVPTCILTSTRLHRSRPCVRSNAIATQERMRSPAR
jgi:hypothetical protein